MELRGLATSMLVFALAACGSAPPTKTAATEASPVGQTAAELTPPEQALRDRVQKLLDERLDEGARITVRVEGTNLWLTGVAPNRHERDRARDIAHEVPGVTRVDVAGLSVR
jgi:hypothetical protein